MSFGISGYFDLSIMYTVILILQLPEEGRRKKTLETTGTQLSWSQYSWKANRLGDGRTEGEEGWAGAGTQY